MEKCAKVWAVKKSLPKKKSSGWHPLWEILDPPLGSKGGGESPERHFYQNTGQFVLIVLGQENLPKHRVKSPKTTMGKFREILEKLFKVNKYNYE